MTSAAHPSPRVLPSVQPWHDTSIREAVRPSVSPPMDGEPISYEGERGVFPLVGDDLAMDARRLGKPVEELRRADEAGDEVEGAEEVEKDADRDNYMSAEEAVAYGLVDKLLDNKKELSQPKES